ncbi:hypothetical protein D7W79_42600, partial [Corallococcus exercitus]
MEEFASGFGERTELHSEATRPPSSPRATVMQRPATPRSTTPAAMSPPMRRRGAGASARKSWGSVGRTE